MTYEINKSSTPWKCFPAGLDSSELIDVSTIEGPWGKFLDLKTGKTHDCSEYFEAAMKMANSV